VLASFAGVTFFSARRGGELVDVGALKHIDAHHAELTSMHAGGQAAGDGASARSARGAGAKGTGGSASSYGASLARIR
jgi:hypothetical protein